MPEEPGAPEQIQVKSLSDYLLVMTKAVFQSGMSWKVVESKLPGIFEAMDGLDVATVAGYDERDIERLAEDKRVIRNGRKLVAIRDNARKLLELEKQYGNFQKHLRSQPDFEATLNMIRKDFKFMGNTGTYYFLYVVGEEVIPHKDFMARYSNK